MNPFNLILTLTHTHSHPHIRNSRNYVQFCAIPEFRESVPVPFDCGIASDSVWAASWNCGYWLDPESVEVAGIEPNSFTIIRHVLLIMSSVMQVCWEAELDVGLGRWQMNMKPTPINKIRSFLSMQLPLSTFNLLGKGVNWFSGFMKWRPLRKRWFQKYQCRDFLYTLNFSPFQKTQLNSFILMS